MARPKKRGSGCTFTIKFPKFVSCLIIVKNFPNINANLNAHLI
jgi:hypothetical protein